MYIVINGGGMIAAYLTPTLLDQGHQVAIIEINEAVADRLAVVLPNQALIICGDGCDSSTQLDAGMDKADVFVATTGKDDDNLVACEIAQLVFKTPRIIARVNSPRNERIFRQMGIEAVSSTTVIAHLIEEEAGLGSMQTAISLSREDIEMNEMVVPAIRAPKGNKTTLRARDIHLPVGSLLAAVRRGDESEIVGPDTVIHPGDVVVFLSKTGVEREVRYVLNNL